MLPESALDMNKLEKAEQTHKQNYISHVID